MNSTACVVQDAVRLTEELDGLDELQPVPTSIRDQMPGLAVMLQSLAGQIEQGGVHAMLRVSIDVRRAYDADDYRAVAAVYARRLGWLTWAEGGFQVGVPAEHLAAFARRHREGPR
jgi:hypothetical protein